MLSLLLSATAAVVATPTIAHPRERVVLTDADRREIVRCLFVIELDKGQLLRGATVLVSPRFNADLLPTDLALQFERLTYETERTATDYFELSNFESRRTTVRASLQRGNWCYRSGSVYVFRGGTGRWRPKPYGFVTSGVLDSNCDPPTRPPN